MLQSTVSLLGNSSTIWNCQFLRKILRIPEDQQKILDNIPGWSSSEESSNNAVLSFTSVTSSKGNQQKNTTLTSEDTPKISEITSVATKKLPQDIRIKDKIIIETKSSSLDSFSFCQPDSFRNLKRSVSFSSIETSATSFANILPQKLYPRKKDTVILKSPLLHIKEVENMETDIQMFSNSAVQCKMSQDSQLPLELNGQISLPSSNFTNKEPSKLVHLYDEDNDKILKSPESKNPIIGTPFKDASKEKSKIDILSADESYISQPVPCAQPPSDNLPHQKELVVLTVPYTQSSDNVSTQKELMKVQKESRSVSADNNLGSASTVIQSSVERNSPLITGKRKRKAKHENAKKPRGVNADEIKIEFSSNQIKNMMELIKVLHEL